ncbi:MAG: DNA topoisomerase III, partial [Oscillibacter sp.]|nr:DNA topoisomerase III [Oscillibacter sp.]
SWCIGHLAGLAEPAVYNPSYDKWRREDLPILPENWRFIIGKDKREQFDVLRTLLRRKDVSEVVNACDAGREGELIFRTAYHLAGCTKPMRRLWISSMEDSAIREGFENLHPGQDYDGLHQAALCRQKADWLVGINATRLFSVLYGRTLNIGRVMSPTLALIVQREAEIAAFEPVPFYTVELDCGGVTLTGERADCKEDAAACEGGTVSVQTWEHREKSEKPPALYDLTTLQRDVNRILGYTAQQTLDYLQALYEKKLCTYPRTDSRYLTDDMESAVPALVSAAVTICGAEVAGTISAAQVCSSAKVSDHHAVVPTTSAVAADLTALPLGEHEILRLVSLSLIRAVCPPYRYTETSLTAECDGQTFSAKGKTVLDLGWRVYAPPSEDAALPDTLAEGQTLAVDAVQVKEGKTAPPKHFTEDTILQSMETAGAGEMPEDAERKGIGTPTTRASILEKLVATGLVERKKAKKITNLLPTQAGSSLVTVLPEVLQSPLLTADWEQRLGEVERGELSPEDFMAGIAAMVDELVKTYRPVPGAEVLFPSGKEAVGPCPRCGGAVIESKKGFFCENREYRFVLWKDSKFFTAKKKALTKAAAAALLNKGRVRLTGCFSEKTGKTYDATVVLEDDGERTNYKLVFDNG